jgi:hypothetical protein
MIDEKVSVRIEDQGSGKSAPRVPVPEKYDGASDAEEYERWLTTFLHWLRVNKCTGPDMDQEQIVYVPMYLGGATLTWFDDNVDGLHRHKKGWTFKEVISGLYDQFIFHTGTQDAADKFYKASYNPDEGAMALYHTLTRYSVCMIWPLDRYTFKSQYMIRLPKQMYEFMVAQGAMPEHSSTETILHYARKAEENMRLMARWNEKRRASMGNGANKPRTTRKDSGEGNASSQNKDR